jgi:hypothetical protein
LFFCQYLTETTWNQYFTLDLRRQVRLLFKCIHYYKTEENKMIWDRSETIALASIRCAACQGLGLVKNAREQEEPCACVLRAIFRACHKRFRRASMPEKRVSVVRWDRSGAGASSHMYFSRKTEEFLADFVNVCRRNLTTEEYYKFKFHYLLGGDVKMVARHLRMDPSNLHHIFDRYEIRLGRAFRETTPFSLFPLDEYFSDTARGEKVYASHCGDRAA